MLDDFLVRALLAGVGLALVTGPAGCFVVWRHLAYFGETIAHSALLGVVLSLVLRIDLVIGIFASACAVTLLMFYLRRRGTLPADTVLGLLAHGGLAVGLVTLAFFPNIRVDLTALLFGDILAVSRTDLTVIWGGGALVLVVLGRIWRPLLAATVNVDLATVAGMHPERTRLIFGLLMAAVIAVAIKIVGILLIVALLGDPAGDGAALRVQPGADGRGRRTGRRDLHRRRAVRLGPARHAVRPVDRGRRPAAVHRDPPPASKRFTHRALTRRRSDRQLVRVGRHHLVVRRARLTQGTIVDRQVVVRGRIAGDEPLAVGAVAGQAEGAVRGLDPLARVGAAVALADQRVQRGELLLRHVGDVDEHVAGESAGLVPQAVAGGGRSDPEVEHLRGPVGRVAVAGIDAAGKGAARA